MNSLLKRRSVFFLSDRTGITVELLGNSLLSQFAGFDFRREHIAFLDSEQRLNEAIGRIEAATAAEGFPALVFSTLVDARQRERLKQTACHLFDLFGSFIVDLETVLGGPSAPAVGRAHGISDHEAYERRVDAMNFCLSHDDGGRLSGLERADIILIGVSRSGKTPTCLYLALHYGVYAANYPLTPDDLDREHLPAHLRHFRGRLLGLSLRPDKLHAIRHARRADSDYAALATCKRELKQAEALFRMESIPCIDSSSLSIEEIASEILYRFHLHSNPGR